MSGTPPPVAPLCTLMPQPPVVSQPVSQPVAPPTPAFRPNKPIMGNHIQINSTKFISFTGEKLNPAWTNTEEGSTMATPSTLSQRRDHYSPCQEITICYRLAKDNANWPPASNAPDLKAPPAGFGNVSQGTVQLVSPNGNKYAMILQASVGGSTFGGHSGRGPKPTDTCNNCGQTGHWAREFPGGQGGSHGTSACGASNSGQHKPWKCTFSGEKQTRNGRVFQCISSVDATPLPTTPPHTKKGTNPAPTSNYMMVEDPSTWLGSVDPFTLPKATTLVFMPIFLYFKFLVIPFLVGCSLGGFLDKTLLAIFDAFENASPVTWITPSLCFPARRCALPNVGIIIARSLTIISNVSNPASALLDFIISIPLSLLQQSLCPLCCSHQPPTSSSGACRHSPAHDSQLD